MKRGVLIVMLAITMSMAMILLAGCGGRGGFLDSGGPPPPESLKLSLGLSEKDTGESLAYVKEFMGYGVFAAHSGRVVVVELQWSSDKGPADPPRGITYAVREIPTGKMITPENGRFELRIVDTGYHFVEVIAKVSGKEVGAAKAWLDVEYP